MLPCGLGFREPTLHPFFNPSAVLVPIELARDPQCRGLKSWKERSFPYGYFSKVGSLFGSPKLCATLIEKDPKRDLAAQALNPKP